MRIRPASPTDVDAIAALHAESWRRSYRGVYRDAYLDGDVFADRLRVWSDRFRDPDPKAVTLVAEVDGDLAGFAHTILDTDPVWGALLDNLHVAAPFQRHGFGRLLMAESAVAVLGAASRPRLFLWVLEQNVAAQAFYRRLGGVVAGSERVEAPGGGPVVGLRVVWDDVSALAGHPPADAAS